MAVSAWENPRLASDVYETAHFPFKQIIGKEDEKGIFPFLFDSTPSLL